MLSTLVRRSALAAGLALSLLALPSVEAQSFSITKTQGNLVSPNGPQRTPVAEDALLMGTWIDSSTKALGSMSAQLFDAGGALSYHLAADVSEYIAVGPGQRFGGISGQLYYGIVPTGIFVEGTWVIDEDSQEGSFDMTFFMGGQTPTAPLLLVGSASGILTPPVISVGGAREPVEASVMRNALGTWITI